MAIACAIVDSILEHYYYRRDAPWMYGADRSDDNPSINGLVTWAFALITYVSSCELCDVQLTGLPQFSKHHSHLVVYIDRVRPNYSSRVYLFRQTNMV